MPESPCGRCDGCIDGYGCHYGVRFITCEGSGNRTHLVADMNLCAMCGNDVAVDEFGDAVEHDRTDMLRMIEEGHFDGK